MYRRHPHQKLNYSPRFRIVQLKSIHFHCCDKLLPLRFSIYSLPVTAKQYRDFHTFLLLRPNHRFLLKFSNVFHDTRWLFDSNPVTQALPSPARPPISIANFFMILNGFLVRSYPVTGRHYRDFHRLFFLRSDHRFFLAIFKCFSWYSIAFRWSPTEL